MLTDNELLLQKTLLYFSVFILIVSYFVDGLNKYAVINDFSFTRMSAIFRVLIEFLLLVSIVLTLNRKSIDYILWIILFTIITVAMQFYSHFIQQYSYPITEQLIIINKYIYIFFVFYLFSYVKQNIDVLSTIYEKILLFNATLVFIGYLFHVKLFETYFKVDFLHGYNGLIPTQNEGTFFFLLGITFFYYKAHFLKEDKWKFIYFLGASLLVGTKGTYIFLLLLLFFHTLIYSSLKFKLFIGVLSVMSGIVLMNINFEYAYYIEKFNEHGLLYVLLSGRNTLLLDAYNYIIQDWTIINWLFGGTNILIYLVEMDFIDLLLMFGIIGSSLYITLYYITFFYWKGLHKFTIVVQIPLFTVIILAGHFFTSAILATYISVLILYIRENSVKILKNAN